MKHVKHRIHQLIHSKHTLSGITAASFFESTIVPIPLEAVLIPLMQVRRDQLWLIALMATLGCILGALCGYALGYYLFDLVGNWLIETFSSQAQFDQAREKMQAQGFWFVLTLGVSPVPFQIAMLVAGATKFSILSFLLATTISRSIRYFGLALLICVAGNQAEALFKRYKIASTITITALILILWWVVNSLS